MSFTESAPPTLESPLSAPGPFGDLSAIDSTLRSIRAVEKSWRLPSIPDGVKLDLAQQAGPNVSSFLYGLEVDLRDADEDDNVSSLSSAPDSVVESLQGQQSGLYIPKGTDFEDTMSAIWADIQGKPRPSDLDINASARMKGRMVEQGLLPVGTVLDNSWSPELNSLKFDLLDKEFADRIAGNDKFGAASIKDATSLIDDWLSPAGLLQAAVDLDLWWDVDAIGKELSGWGDKWRKVGKSEGPFDFAKNFVDAALGPIDDLAFPVLNWALMFTGVGEAFAATRIAYGAGKVYTGARAVDGLYQGGKFLRAADLLVPKAFKTADVAAEFERFGQASWLGGRLQGTRSLSGVGDAMAEWRKLKAVRLTKKYTQVGMRLGVAGRLEEASPFYQSDGFGLGDTPAGEQATEALGTLRKNPIWQGVTEAALTPYNIFQPGSITDVFKRGGNIVTDIVSGGSRVVGATGRGLETVTAGRVGKHLTAAAFRKVNENQELTAVWHKATLAHLSTDPDALADYTNKVTQLGSVDLALAAHYGVDLDDLGAAKTFATIAAAIDHVASAKASAVVKQAEERGAKWWKQYHRERSSLVGQIRGVDMSDDDAVLWRIAGKAGNSRAEVVQKFNELKANPVDVADWRNLAAADNETARTTLQTLLSADSGFDSSVLETYLPQVLPTLGNWSGFVRATKEIEDLDRTGLLLNMIMKGRGDPLDRIVGTGDDVFVDMGDDIFQVVQENQLMFDGLTPDKYAQAITKKVNRGNGKATVMHVDGVTKQELDDQVRSLSGLLRLHNSTEGIYRKTGGRKLLGELEALGDVSGWDAATVRNLAQNERQKTVVNFMHSHGVNPADLRKSVADKMHEVASSIDWQRYDQGMLVTDKGGAVLSGANALAKRMRSLKEKANRTAAEIDLDEMISAFDDAGEVAHATRLRQLKDNMDEAGYKLVHGQEFMMPSDLLDTLPFQDVTAEHIRGSQVAGFFRRKLPGELVAIRNRHLREALAVRLMETQGEDLGVLSTMKFWKPGREGRRLVDMESVDLDDLVADLDGVVDKVSRAAAEQIEQTFRTGNFTSRRIAALKYARVPKSIEDLALGLHRQAVIAELRGKYGERGAAIVWESLKKSKVRSFQDAGLYALETKVRSSNLSEILSAASGVKGSAVIGAGVGVMQTDKDASIQEKLTGAAIGAGAGAAFGATGGKVVSAGAKAFEKAAEGKRWARYMYLPDELGYLRDYLRFTLNPFLDLQRYSEGWTLGVTQKLPPGVKLPISDSTRALKRKMVEDIQAKKGLAIGQAKDEAEALYQSHVASFRRRQQLAGYDTDSLSSVSRYAADIGLMGYIPEQKMTNRYVQLMSQGVDSDQAHEIARSIYTYGVTGRSSAELTANFIFFPFSYQKKFLGSVGRFITDDMSRIAVIHDGLKTYEWLNENYDLNEKLGKHLPVLEALGKFNPFQFGLSLGAFGGVNAPVLDPIMNAFVPHMLNIKTAENANQAKTLMRRMLPVWGDIDRLKQGLLDQGYAAVSPHHQSQRADVEAGWSKWQEFRSQVSDLLTTKGFTWDQLSRNPDLAPLYQYTQVKKMEIAAEHPAWEVSRTKSIGNATARSEELRQRRLMGEQFETEWDGVGPRDENFLLLKFSELRDRLNEVIGKQGMDLDGGNPPIEAVEALRQLAVEYTEENPSFALLYRSYFERSLGPIQIQAVG